MKLHIRIREGLPVNHPALEDNLIQAFGKVPEDWQPFVRIEAPTLGVYDVLAQPEPTYEFVNGVWTDVWHVREMTQEEKLQKQEMVKNQWNSRPNRQNFLSWVFDEATCSFVAPVAKPEDGKQYFWDGASNSWKEVIQP